MRNTTKKILSMILAVIILLSVMPMAYAERATYSPEVEQYIEIWTRIQSYRDNKYEGGYRDNKDIPNADFDKVSEIINEAYHEVIGIVGSESAVPEAGSEDFKNINLDVVPVFNVIMQPAIDEVEDKIASGEIKVVINVYELYKYYLDPITYYDIDEYNDIVDGSNFINNEKYADMSLEALNSFEEMFRYREDPTDGMTQAEFDAIWKEKFSPWYDMVIDCLDGNHPYSEYISNGDATEEADDTKTLICEFCGAEKPVKDAFIEEYARWGAYYEFCSYAEGIEEAHRYIDNLDSDTAQDILRAGKENDAEKMLTYIEMFKEKNAEIEKAIDDGKLTVVIDGYYVALLMCKCFFYGNDLETDINGRPLYIYERNAELFEEADAAYQKANDIRLDGGTQDEFDAAIKKWVDAYSLGLEHVYGNHDFTEADGTKTSVCEFCGAKEIVFEGQYGDNLYFDVDSSGKLTLSGSGEAWTPWEYIEYIENNFNDEQINAAEKAIIKIDEMIITETVSDIGAWALLGFHSVPDKDHHPKLEKITVDENNPYLVVENNILFNNDKTELIMYPKMADATEYVVPERVKKISDWAFYGCSDLEDITISTSVDYIGTYALNYCLDLKNINYCGTKEDWIRINTDTYNETDLNTLFNFEAHKDIDGNDICDYCKTNLKEEINDSTDTDNGNDNNTVNCSCNCHKGGFMGIIWKILTFFYKIFGMNKTCACGVAHY